MKRAFFHSGAWALASGGPGSGTPAAPPPAPADPRAEAGRLAAVLASEPARHDLRVDRGRLLWRLGEGEEARAEWARVPEGAPERPAARLALGLERLFSFHGGEAVADLEAGASAPGRDGALARGTLAILREQWAAARDLLRPLEGWEAGLLRAWIESRDPAGAPATAVREYEAALRDGPRLAWALAEMGRARARLGDHLRAIEDYSEALRAKPDLAEAYLNRGNARRELKLDTLAVEDYSAALRSRPDFPEALNNRALSRSTLGDRRGAEEDFSAAVRLRPDFAEAWYNRGVLRMEGRDLGGAIEDFRAALRHRPNLGAAMLDLGYSLRARGDWQGAAEWLRRFVAHAPGHPGAAEARSALEECERKGSGR
ncbi:MAG: tetratricopeptide repeat protein [Planctomycetales bacterium]|nr:tetratricopeptide repeat protein [Planctomycetales bacterium]